MPVIRITDQTYEKLRSQAAPFEKPDAVIARALDALTAAPKSSTKLSVVPQTPARTDRPKLAAHGPQLPKKFYREPLLQTMYELGGRAKAAQVREAIERTIAPHLRSGDLRLLSDNHQPRWWNAVQWTRHSLVQEGLFRNDSERGAWELTDEGIKSVEALMAKNQNKKATKR